MLTLIGDHHGHLPVSEALDIAHGLFIIQEVDQLTAHHRHPVQHFNSLQSPTAHLGPSSQFAFNSLEMVSLLVGQCDQRPEPHMVRFGKLGFVQFAGGGLCCAIRIEAGLVPFPDIFSACGPSRASRVM